MKHLKSLLFIVLLSTIQFTLLVAQPATRIKVDGKELFLNGGNGAWVNFARDFGPGTTRFSDFEDMFKQLNENGANSVRIWFHTTGSNSPEFSGDVVIGPGEGTISDARTILDLGLQYKVGVTFCLWSFDMLRISNGSSLVDRNRRFLEDTTLIRSYINNALIPMVEALGDHPALFAWEIFNEPEGMSKEFGWQDITGSINQRVSMSVIQRFINLTAGAIHRTNPSNLVSNGAWSFRSLWDGSTGTNDKNYYSDNQLIGSGGDQQGRLDFYMVHYYEWAGTELSPFHHPASRWNLSKPLIVGEFGVPDGSLFGIPSNQLYQRLYDNGYGGGWSWQWVDWYQNRGGGYAAGWLRSLPQMKSLAEAYPNEINFNFTSPWIQTFTAQPTKIEKGGSTKLSWKVLNPGNVKLNGESVAGEGERVVSPDSTTTYYLQTSTDTAKIVIQVVNASQVNRALNKPATASSSESGLGNEDPNFAFDGDLNTRWSSVYADNQWISVDLQELVDIREVVLNWEQAYPSKYRVEGSQDGFRWTVLAREDAGNGGLDTVSIASTNITRFVRVFGEMRAANWGISLFEVEVYGSSSPFKQGAISISSPAPNQVYGRDGGLVVSYNFEDSDGTLAALSVFLDGDSLTTKTAFNTPLVLEDLTVGNHSVQLVAIDNDAIAVSSTVVSFRIAENFIRRRFEAESAALSGAISTESGPAVSNGNFVNMAASGSIRWADLALPSADSIQITIRYNLPFGYKEQILQLNGTVLDTIAFTEPAEIWQSKEIRYSLNEPTAINDLSINGFWHYMWFDYLELAYEPSVSTSINDDLAVDELPISDRIDKIYPNPFNPTTTIQFMLASPSKVRLQVFDLSGRMVSELANKAFSSGSHYVSWNAINQSSGVYLLRLETGNGVVQTQKLTLLK